MDALDGNSIGGLLIDVFGADMTAVSSVCGTCNARRPVAELRVYGRAPGTVVRCRSCGAILMVFAHVRDVICVDLAGLAELG
jgi:ribosomal protein L40E